MNNFEKILELATELRPEAVDFACRTIRVPSLSGEEGEVSKLYLQEMKTIGYDQVFRDDWGNIVGIIYGQESGPTIMYNGHMDVVPEGDSNLWGKYEPYGAEIDMIEVDNQDMDRKEMAEVIHGRGAGDVKGGLACQIYAGKALLKLREQGLKLKGNYMVAAVTMEECGDQIGTIKLIDDTFPQRGLNYDGVISCEPTKLKIALGHRGRMEILVSVFGKACHGSSPWLGVNAVFMANKLIHRIANELPKKLPTDPDLGQSTITLTIINCSPSAVCIVPDRFDFLLDRRFIPGETPEMCVQQIQDMIDELKKEDSDFQADVKIAQYDRTFYTGKSTSFANVKDSYKIPQNHPLVEATAQGIKEVGQPVKYQYWSFGTDMPKICATDHKPAIGYSPMQESYIHTPHDKVRIDYMEKSIAGYASIFLKLMELPKEAFHLE